ncbi:MAG: serine/threonine-protein kinase [Kofleriaceae bacterium]
MGEAFGSYRVFEQLGLGGMAVVHRAEHTAEDGTRRVVALKRLLPELARDRSYVRRFVDEARLGQRLRHANIIRTFEVGRIEGMHFMALEYVRGPTLLQLLQGSIGTQPMPLAIALHVITQVARALAYAHALRDETGRPLQLIHRDIAPSNIIVSDAGATKLIDFGVAKTAVAHVRTNAGCVIGKLGYVAPEYLTGKLDARVDLFSLGVVAHELLTARPLFAVGDLRSAELLRLCAIDPPSSINPSVPAELDAIVMTALQHDPDQRWQSAFAMYTALSNFAHETGLAVHDREVAAWVATDVDIPRPAPVAAAMPTAELDIEIDIELAFARVVRTRSRDLEIAV